MALGWRKEYSRYKSFFLNIINLYRQKKDLRMFLEIILSLVTVAFFGVFALRPTFVTIASLLKEIKAKEETVAKMDEKISNLATARNIFDSESGRIAMVESAVPDGPEPDAFVRQIEGAVLKNSVRLLGVSIGEVVLKGTPEKERRSSSEFDPLPQESKAMEFSISITGDYPSLSAFLRDFESLRRPAKIDILGINSSETEVGRVLVLVVSGRTPYFDHKTETVAEAAQ